jgi:hypothetical protein
MQALLRELPPARWMQYERATLAMLRSRCAALRAARQHGLSLSAEACGTLFRMIWNFLSAVGSATCALARLHAASRQERDIAQNNPRR